MEFASSESVPIDVPLAGVRNVMEYDLGTLAHCSSKSQEALDLEAFKRDYEIHLKHNIDSIILVGYGQFTMHYAVALIALRGVPCQNIFIIERSQHIGGCLLGGNSFGWFAAPFEVRMFYPFALYGTCYHKMLLDRLGTGLREALANMTIVRDHFGLRVYMGTDFDRVSDLLVHPQVKVVYPRYRDIISGRQPGAMNGLDNIDLSAANFHLIGLGNTSADVAPELVRRRTRHKATDFTVTMCYRTPRTISTYLANGTQPPGFWPMYYTFGRVIKEFDALIFGKHWEKYPKIHEYVENMRKYYLTHEPDGKRFMSSNFLMGHPGVANKLRFFKVRDRSEAATLSANGPVLDCTNVDTSSGFYFSESEPSDNRKHFIPRLQHVLLKNGKPCSPPGFANLQKRKVNWSVRLASAFSGQMSTAYGAMAMVVRPHEIMDDRIGYARSAYLCAIQCYSGLLFARYHMVANLFAKFCFGPLWEQFLAQMMYDGLMRALTLSGFTLLLMDTGRYNDSVYSSASRGWEIAKAKWEWFGKELGGDTPFPIARGEMPTIPICFSYDWIIGNKSKFVYRMLITSACLTLVLLL